MNTKPCARGITLLSGAGGSGRTSAGIGIAASLAQKGHRTLYFDLCFGWGGLNIGTAIPPSYHELFLQDDMGKLCETTDLGFDLITCAPPDILNPDNEELKRITYLIHEFGGRYDFIILDPPASAQPLSLLAAGLCEEVILVVRPDAAAVASSYSLLKTLIGEGLGDRVKIAFSMVDTPEMASSLKAKFDKLTRQFMDATLPDGGFIYLSDNSFNDNFQADRDAENFISSAKNIVFGVSQAFQNETNDQAITQQMSV